MKELRYPVGAVECHIFYLYSSVLLTFDNVHMGTDPYSTLQKRSDKDFEDWRFRRGLTQSVVEEMTAMNMSPH